MRSYSAITLALVGLAPPAKRVAVLAEGRCESALAPPARSSGEMSRRRIHAPHSAQAITTRARSALRQARGNLRGHWRHGRHRLVNGRLNPDANETVQPVSR